MFFFFFFFLIISIPSNPGNIDSVYKELYLVLYLRKYVLLKRGNAITLNYGVERSSDDIMNGANIEAVNCRKFLVYVSPVPLLLFITNKQPKPQHKVQIPWVFSLEHKKPNQQNKNKKKNKKIHKI